MFLSEKGHGMKFQLFLWYLGESLFLRSSPYPTCSHGWGCPIVCALSGSPNFKAVSGHGLTTQLFQEDGL